MIREGIAKLVEGKDLTRIEAEEIMGERVVACSLEGVGYSFKHAFAVMSYHTRFAMHQPSGMSYFSTEGVDYPLMTQADT